VKAGPFSDLERTVLEAPIEDLPAVVGDLERLKAIAWTRLNRPAEAVPAGADGDRLLTADEAAARLGVPRSYLYRNRLPFRVTVSPGRVRFSSAGIDRFIKKRLQDGYSRS
jgi:predicted DNA-binding transcriptional regulator AlpA